MQDLEQKVDIIIEKQEAMQESIRNIQNNEINILTVQRDLLKTQFEMQQEIHNLKENQKIMQEDIGILKENQKTMQEDMNVLKENQKIIQEDIKGLKDNQTAIRQDIVKLENKVDNNQEQLSKRLDENLYEISNMFQDVYKRIPSKNKKIAIL